MTKVEELRYKVMEHCGVAEPWYGDPIAMTVDSLIAAARSEGVAEGAAEERERIRLEAIEHGCWSWVQEGEKMIQTVEIRADVIVPKEASHEQT